MSPDEPPGVPALTPLFPAITPLITLAQGLGLAGNSVVVAWTMRTQSITNVLDVIDTSTGVRPFFLTSMGITTAQLGLLGRQASLLVRTRDAGEAHLSRLQLLEQLGRLFDLEVEPRAREPDRDVLERMPTRPQPTAAGVDHLERTGVRRNALANGCERRAHHDLHAKRIRA